MSLITTISEVKSLIPNFVSNLSEVESLPNFDLFDSELLIPVTGLGLYEDLQTKKTAGALTPDETSLLKKMQMVSVCYAYSQSLALGHITITDTGAKKFTPKDTTPVAKWEFEKAQKALHTMALSAVDALVGYLLVKLPALWLSSEYYITASSLYIKTGAEFDSLYKLRNPAATYYFIRGRIADAQTIYLNDSFGVDFLTYLMGGSAPVAIANQLRLMKKALAFFTIHQCCLNDNVAFGAEGFSIAAISEDNFSQRAQAPGLDVDMKARQSEMQGNDFLNRAKYELVQYYHQSGADAGFKAALEASPLEQYVVPALRTSGNERRKGVFRM